MDGRLSAMEGSVARLVNQIRTEVFEGQMSMKYVLCEELLQELSGSASTLCPTAQPSGTATVIDGEGTGRSRDAIVLQEAATNPQRPAPLERKSPGMPIARNSSWPR